MDSPQKHLHRYIISGGPGAGKSTLLQALQQRGYSIFEEASRSLIIEEIRKGSHCLPWLDLSCFAQKALLRMVHHYESASPAVSTAFFDRGIPDIVAYLEVAQLPVGSLYQQALVRYPYDPLVFLAPPWPEIYVNDSERWQSYDEAVSLYYAIKRTYHSLNYTLLELPKASVAQRVQFIESHL